MPDRHTILQNEQTLFARVATGDEAAFTEIFNYYEPRLYPFVFKITQSEIIAEEVVQEVFVKLWTNREKMDHVKDHRSYIFRIASNKTMNHLRSIARRSQVMKQVTAAAPQQANTTEETIELREMQQLVNDAVQQLSKAQKKVYTLSRQQGLNTEQIAEELNISQQTVKNHLTDALRTIREYLRKTPGVSIPILLIVLRYYL